jgi:ribosomal protein S12 methylthiotransferase accessory factor
MHIDIDFPGGKRVAAGFKGHRVVTDQPRHQEGSGSAPSPFDLFLTSIATCMGFYALEFCQARGLTTEGMSLTLDAERDPESRLVRRVRVGLRLPGGFPQRYARAIVRAMERCSVKRHLYAPPEFEVATEFADGD